MGRSRRNRIFPAALSIWLQALSVGIIAVVNTLGSNLNTTFQSISTQLK